MNKIEKIDTQKKQKYYYYYYNPNIRNFNRKLLEEPMKEDGIRIFIDYDRLFDSDIRWIINILRRELRNYLKESGYSIKYKKVLFDIDSIRTSNSIEIDLFVAVISRLMSAGFIKILEVIYHRLSRKKIYVSKSRRKRINRIAIKRIYRKDKRTFEEGTDVDIFIRDNLRKEK